MGYKQKSLSEKMGLKILVLGATGMLGHTLFKELFNKYSRFFVLGTVRSLKGVSDFFTLDERKNIIENVSVNVNTLLSVMSEYKPDIVINCIGIVKQLSIAKDPLKIIPINSLFPHRLSLMCRMIGAKLIHISTDCVFSGKKGDYKEDDFADANDLYGRSKYLGEIVNDYDLTIRTSIIGYELRNKLGLLEWFFSQKDKIQGYKKAVFTGFPTIELARIIADYVIPNDLTGLYHISSKKISKYELLILIANKYDINIVIEPDETVNIDMSLDSTKFKKETGYKFLSWSELIDKLYETGI